jgi:DNA-binding NtrC family response regulator
LKRKLLFIDDDAVFCNMLVSCFGEEYDVTGFTDPGEAVRYISENPCEVVVTDLSMPEIDGLEVLRAVKGGLPDADVVIMTAYGSIDTAVEAMKEGAYDYIIKPFTTDELLLHLKNLFEKRRLYEENVDLRKYVGTKFRPENIVGESEGMQEVYRLIERVAQSDSTVLITGESGTGKELVARAIHFSGKRKDRRIVSLNCTAIPETLLESELFGYAKGAFSGASTDKTGLLEYADGGTIFLDEIADAPLSIQAKLLRFLQDRKFRPVGSNKEVSVDVRVVCATNRDMVEMINENKFRQDLYYRINVVAVHLPPLRERKEDIPSLISIFLADRKKIHPGAVSLLCRHDWPGNVRELKNLMERLVTFTDSDTVTPDDLPPEFLLEPFVANGGPLSYNEAKKKVLDDFNRSIIAKSLVKHEGNVTRAAEELKLDRANFQRLMRKYGISARDFREHLRGTEGPDMATKNSKETG